MQYLSQRLAEKPAQAPSARQPHGAVAATQRERLLDATERLIAEKGCAGTSIEAIVKVARVSSVTFYEHFEDKEGCFAAAFDRAVDEAEGELSAAVPAELPWPGQVEAALRALLAAVVAEPARARMCLVEAQMGGPALAARYEAALDAAVRWLRRGRAVDSASLDASEAVEEATVAGIAWLLRERLERGAGETVGDLLPKLVEIALSPYIAGGGTAPPAAFEPA